MGRQSHLASFALGRSPFQAPIRDDEDGFILGPNVQHATAPGYVQQFNARGHPRNEASEQSRRRLNRAQNDALATVGVVVKKAKKNQNRWHNLSAEQKERQLLDESVAGTLCRSLAELYRRFATRWILSIRRRLLTFRTYLDKPFSSIVLADWNNIGPRAFFFSGYPLAAISEISQTFRNDMLEADPVPDPSQVSSPFSYQDLLRFLRRQCLQLTWFAFEYPFQACSILQSLTIIPQSLAPPLWEFFPIRLTSLFSSQALGYSQSTPGTLGFIQQVLLHPFVLAYIQDRVGRLLFSYLHGIMHRLIIRPGKPDQASSIHARHINYPETNATLLHQLKASVADFGHRDPIRLCEHLLFVIFNSWERNFQVRRGLMAVEMCPSLENDIIQRVTVYYIGMQRENQTATRENRLSARTMRMMALQNALNDYHIDQDDADAGTDLSTDDVDSLSQSNASTSTPDPQDIDPELTLNNTRLAVPPDEDATEEPTGLHTEPEAPIRSERANRSDSANIVEELDVVLNESRPAIPLQAMLDGAAESTTPDTWARASTPIPGISRASSLPHNLPRPVRRPTDIEERLVYRPRPMRSSRQAEDGLYRVTKLSTHAAEFFARGSASLVKSMLMLPIDLLFLRALAKSVLTPEKNADGSLGIVFSVRNVWGVLDISSFKSLKFWNAWFLGFGLEGLIGLAVWRTTTRVALELGSELCGWGHF